LVCLEDDAQGEEIEVFWEREIDAQLVGTGSWNVLVPKGKVKVRRVELVGLVYLGRISG